MPKVGVEWVNNYDWLNQLTHEHEDAGGFYDELVQHAGWIGSFNWGNGNAWEDDFKRTDKIRTATPPPGWTPSTSAASPGTGAPAGSTSVRTCPTTGRPSPIS